VTHRVDLTRKTVTHSWHSWHRHSPQPTDAYGLEVLRSTETLWNQQKKQKQTSLPEAKIIKIIKTISDISEFNI